MNTKTRVLNLLRRLFLLRPFENFLVKKTQGKPTTSLVGRMVPNNYQYKEGSIRQFKTFDNVVLEADISDYVGHHLYYGFQDLGHEALFRLVNKGNIILDIGTNLGATLLHFAALTGNKGFVYGFEPDPINYNNCLNNIALNGFTNIDVSQIGLGNKAGSFNLVVDIESNRGGNRISDAETSKNKTVITVERLDDWAEKKAVHAVNLIKIDVEGFEYKVLKGGENLVKKTMPTLFIELDDNNLKNVGDSAQDLIKLLEGWGYSVKNSLNNEYVFSTNDFEDCHYDIIAEPKA